MDNNFLLTDDLLWDYADGFLDPAVQEQVSAYLRQHPEWQSRLDAVMEDRKALLALPLDKPNTGFGDRVMAAWVTEQVHAKAVRPANDWIIRLIAIGFLFFTLTPLLMMVFLASGSEETTTTNVRWQVDLPSVDIAAWLSHPALHYTLYLGITFLALSLIEKSIKRWTANG
jgi:anti-sigma factor RsiW